MRKPVHSPFDTIFDGDEESDGGSEWWDEDENLPSKPAGSRAEARITRWPEVPGGLIASPLPSPTKNTPQSNLRKVDRRYSVHKPLREKSKGRQRKQNALAGIKVVTNFSKNGGAAGQPPVPHLPRAQPQNGCFVDLAALQALGGEEPSTAPPPAASGALASFWKSRKNKEMKRAPYTVPSMSTASSGPSNGDDSSQNLRPRGAVPVPLELDLSPCDRPIVIGISVPSARLAEHSMSPETAATDNTNIYKRQEHSAFIGRSPETPTIIITPAHAGSIWSALDDSNEGRGGNRPSSSVFSHEPRNIMGIYGKDGAPVVPMLPASIKDEKHRLAAEKSYFSPDSEDGAHWEEEDRDLKSKSRPFSTETMFEEDESPIISRRDRAISASMSPRSARRASVSTVDTQRRSKGWWNYILNTPFMSRSNTVAQRGVFEDHVPPPAMPSLAIAAAKAQEADRARQGDMWEKNLSPMTPETTTTTFSDTWWDISGREDEIKHFRSPEQTPELRDTRHKAKPSTETTPYVLSETAGFGGRSTSTIPHVNSESQLDRSVDIGSNLRDERGSPAISALPTSRDLATSSGSPNSVQPRLEDIGDRPNDREPVHREVVEPSQRLPSQAPLPTPPPPYSPPPARAPRYRAILPPVQDQTQTQTQTRTPSPSPAPPQPQARSFQESDNLQYPISPGPLTPGLQQTMASRGGIPLSEVPLTPAPRRPIGSQYPDLPLRQTPMVFQPPPTEPLSKKAQKAEAKRRRHEKEEAVAHKAGGWWRGRGCIPDKGCYGRKGAEGRKKRRCYCCLIIGFLFVIILAVVLATTLHRTSNTVIGPSQWVNLTGFPPIFTGLSTIADPANINTDTSCVVPSTQWSCDLPQELHASVSPNPSNRPNFLLDIQWDNSTSANTTFANVTGNPNIITRTLVGNPVSAGQLMKHLLLKARDIVSFSPNPAPPPFAEEFFLGNTTDKIVSSNKAGEPTPFYISFLDPTTSLSTLTKRASLPTRDTAFPNITSEIPAASVDANGTAAPANLLPLPTQQPIRLYDRGLDTEHYGFYSYFDRSIFLSDITTTSPVSADASGGSPQASAKFRCTWAQTRFLVQMWTRRTNTSRLLNETVSVVEGTASLSFAQPGTLPYPVTVTLDRHGGVADEKMLYCYPIDSDGGITGVGVFVAEERGSGGTLVNPAADIFDIGTVEAVGGVDGGTGGCGCQWSNFIAVS